MRNLVASFLSLGLLWGCASPLPRDEPMATDASSWHAFELPGKRATEYTAGLKDGRPAVRADADHSASMWRRKVDIPADRLGDVGLSWWVEAPIAGADLASPDRTDAPARVIFSFDGDRSTLSPRNRMMFELARALSGEDPPYATLAYVFATDAPVDSVIVHPRTDRIRKIVLDSGARGARQWRDHRRNLVKDFRRAFGEAPGRLVGVAFMTDGDNTRSRVTAWYGPVTLDP